MNQPKVRLLFLMLIISSLLTVPLYSEANSRSQLILKKNSNLIIHDGRQFLASQPLTIMNGGAFVALNGIARPFGYTLNYDVETKEAVATLGLTELRFKSETNVVKVNGEPFSSPATLFNKNGSLMIPLRLWTELTDSTVTLSGNDILINWDSSNNTLEDSISKVTTPLSPLQVSSNGRFLEKSDGTPFFWMADTAWETIQRLTRREVVNYMNSSAEQGFNVIQVVALAETWNRKVPNANGDLPLIGEDPTYPLITTGSNPALTKEYDYWDHADFVIDTAASLGMYIAFLPTWGKYIIDNSGSPYNQPYQGIFDETKAYNYGKWVGERYANKSNMVWVLGGDRYPTTESSKAIIRQMAKGIKDGGGDQLMTYHPIGGKSSSSLFHNESWLDFNMYQSGHIARNLNNYSVITSDYAKTPVKPVIDAEPRYEGGGINFNSANGRFQAYDVRQAAYWSVFAGSFGHTYGHDVIWQMYAPGRESDSEMYWYEALDVPGRSQMKYLRRLIESRPMLDRVPDQSIVNSPNSAKSEFRATRGKNYAMIYIPWGRSLSVKLGIISGDNINASWYNPRTGVSTLIGNYDNTGTVEFNLPTEEDWVLLIDDSSAGFTNP